MASPSDEDIDVIYGEDEQDDTAMDDPVGEEDGDTGDTEILSDD